MAVNGKKEEDMYKILARFMTMEAKYPEECKKAREESWQKLVSFSGNGKFLLTLSPS